MDGALVVLLIPIIVGVLVVMFFAASFTSIGPAEVGLVTKRLGRKLEGDQLVAMKGEAGYQADLLMPGLRFKLWPIFKVQRYAWVQVPPDHIGLVIAQVGAALPTGAKSAIYKPEFGSFADIRTFLGNGGQRGVQRPVLPPGTTAPIHPVGFVVITRERIFGKMISEATRTAAGQVEETALNVTHITPQGETDIVGVVTTLEGPASGDIASRIGGFSDVTAMEADEEGGSPTQIIQAVLRSKNHLHDNYQDYQAFLANGGCIGLQHDPLLYGSYLLNPFLVKVELREMLVVRQGEVAVIKSYVGLPTEDTSGDEFKFGSIVKPGHQGIWSEPLRTGKYTLNPRIYEAEIVPTSILTLNWSHATSDAHSLDERLAPIDAKSREAFTFSIDLQVQIHVPDTRAPKVISMVGTMKNLVNEVLQSAVGNYFRNKLQTLGATEFIEKRDEVQHAAESYIQSYLSRYEVETRGVYIQDVIFPADLVEVLTTREIAAQEKATFAQQQRGPGGPGQPRAAAGRGRHAGAAGPGQRLGRHREGEGAGRQRPGRRRGRGHHDHRQRRGHPDPGHRPGHGQRRGGARPGPGQGLRRPAAGHRFPADRHGGGPPGSGLGPRQDRPRHPGQRGGRRAQRPRRHAHAQPGRHPQRQRPRGQRVRARPARAGRR